MLTCLKKHFCKRNQLQPCSFSFIRNRKTRVSQRCKIKKPYGRQVNCNAKDRRQDIQENSEIPAATAAAAGANARSSYIFAVEEQLEQDAQLTDQLQYEQRKMELSNLETINVSEKRNEDDQNEEREVGKCDEKIDEMFINKCRSALAMNVKHIQDEIPLIDKSAVDNFEEIFSAFQESFGALINTSIIKSRELACDVQLIESALTTLAEYNKQVLSELNEMTVDPVASVDVQNTMTHELRLNDSVTALRRAKLLAQFADKQLEYSREIGSIARPLALWPVDASRVVWEARRILKTAEKKHREMNEKTPLYMVPTTNQQKSDNTFSIDYQLELKHPRETEMLSAARVYKLSSAGQSSRTEPVHEEPSSLSRSSISLETSELRQMKRQPIKLWPKHTYYSSDGEIICYVRAPSDCLRKKENLNCSFSEPLAPWPPIAGHSESIGRFVSIEPLKNRRSAILPEEAWIIGIPHNYGKIASKEMVLYMIEAGPEGVSALKDDNKNTKQTDLVYWRDLPTTDVISGEKRFLEARLTRLTNVTFAPFVRLRRDSIEIGKSGGRLQCLTDPRVTLTVPPDATKVKLSYAIQVQQLDFRQVNSFKERNQALTADFIACSPIVYLTCARKLLFKPITLTLPVPETSLASRPVPSLAMQERMNVGTLMDTSSDSEEIPGPPISSKTPVDITYDGFQKSLILPQLLARSRTEVSEVVLMQKSESTGYKWVVSKDADILESLPEMTTFNLRRMENCRLLVLKMRKVTDAETLALCATYLEHSLSQHLAYISVRQHQKHPHQLCLLVSTVDQLESELHKLAQEGYKEGERPHGPVFLSEGQQLDVFFKSNIRLFQLDNTGPEHHKHGISIMFSSAIANSKMITVKVADPSAQVGLDEYRGFIDIYCEREILVSAIHRRGGGVDAARESPFANSSGLKIKRTRFRQTTERTQLARIVIKLPKDSTVSLPQAKRKTFRFEARDCVDNKYLKQLAKGLPSDTWKRLGMALNMSRGRIQAIGGKTFGDVEEQAYAMLISWIKTLPVSANRFAILYHALQTIGRTDLALQLRDRSEEYWKEEETTTSS